MVWTAARRLRAESERACDDLALCFGAQPADYAEHLLDIVTCVRDHSTPAIALAMAHRKEFEGRMLAILNPELRRTNFGRLQSASLVGVLSLLVVVISAAAPARQQGSGMPAPLAAALPAPAPAQLPAAAKPPEPVQQNDNRHVETRTRYDTTAYTDIARAYAKVRYAPRHRVQWRHHQSLGTADAAAPHRHGCRRPAYRCVGIEPLRWRRVGAQGARCGAGRRCRCAGARDGGLGDRQLRRCRRDGAVEGGAHRSRPTPFAKSPPGDSATAPRMAVPTWWHRRSRTTGPKGFAAPLAWALGQFGVKHAPRALVAALTDPDEDVRYKAAWAAGEIGDSITLPVASRGAAARELTARPARPAARIAPRGRRPGEDGGVVEVAGCGRAPDGGARARRWWRDGPLAVAVAAADSAALKAWGLPRDLGPWGVMLGTLRTDM
jgi:hypothetical protein